MRNKGAHVLAAMILLLSLSSAHAQLFPVLSVPLAVLDVAINVLKFVTNAVQTLVLMSCNLGQNDPSVKAAYNSLIVHKPNENVTSCLIGCLASAAYKIEQTFVNTTKIDPFFLVHRIIGDQNYQQVQYCARKVQEDKCAMSFLFIDCVLNQFYSKFTTQFHDFQDGIRRVVNGFPRLMQEYIAKDGVPGGYFDIVMGLPTLIPRLLNFTSDPYQSATTPQFSVTTDEPYQVHILTPAPVTSYPSDDSQDSFNTADYQSD